jgi:hypothetical protein
MKSHRTTEERRAFVKTLSGLCLTHEEIASILRISSKTLVRKYRKQLDEGKANAHASVSAKLFKQITSDDKSMSTAHQRVWWLNRNYPAESNDPGQPLRAIVTVNLPDNGRNPHLPRHQGGQVRIIDAVANPMPKLVVGKAE